MRKTILTCAALAALIIAPAAANANERVYTGVAIGAGAGAVVAGPVGAVVGGVVGAVVKGPRLRHRECWMSRSGHRHCHWTW